MKKLPKNYGGNAMMYFGKQIEIEEAAKNISEFEKAGITLKEDLVNESDNSMRNRTNTDKWLDSQKNDNESQRT